MLISLQNIVCFQKLLPSSVNHVDLECEQLTSVVPFEVIIFVDVVVGVVGDITLFLVCWKL